MFTIIFRILKYICNIIISEKRQGFLMPKFDLTTYQGKSHNAPWHSGSALDYRSTGRATDPAPGA